MCMMKIVAGIMRHDMGSGQKRRERTQVMPGGVTREEHAYLPDGDRLHMLDVYRPEGVEGALPPFADGSSRSLTGGCAVSYQTDKILYMGGVNYDRFLDALSRPLRIARAEASGDTATAARLREEEKAYMLRPVEWYRFNTTLLRYDVSAKSWSELGDFEPLARAGAGAVMEGDRLTIVNGELKPGVRSPRVSQATIEE